MQLAWAGRQLTCFEALERGQAALCSPHPPCGRRRACRAPRSTGRTRLQTLNNGKQSRQVRAGGHQVRRNAHQACNWPGRKTSRQLHPPNPAAWEAAEEVDPCTWLSVCHKICWPPHKAPQSLTRVRQARRRRRRVLRGVQAQQVVEPALHLVSQGVPARFGRQRKR